MPDNKDPGKHPLAGVKQSKNKTKKGTKQ